MTPQPIDTAPPGDGWILGLVADNGAEVCQRQPWAILTRCDGGWCDDEGYGREPRAWAPLPDPQPSPSGWRPAVGHVLLTFAWGSGDWRWRGWLASIEKEPGVSDKDREPAMYDDIDTARREAAKWAASLGLPLIEANMEPKPVLSLVEPSR